MNVKYILVSLPNSFFDNSRREVPSLVADVATEPTAVSPFSTPNFKIGTLDGLMQNADDLSKLFDSCRLVASKVTDCFKVPMERVGENLGDYQVRNRSMFSSTFRRILPIDPVARNRGAVLELLCLGLHSISFGQAAV